MTVFEDLRDELLASELAIPITWRPQPDGSSTIAATALPRSRTRVGELGNVVRVSEDVVRLKVSRAAVPGARVEDRVDVHGSRYRVTALLDPEADDRHGLWWFVTGHLVAA